MEVSSWENKSLEAYLSGRKAVPVEYRTSEKSSHPCSIREASLPLRQVAGMEFDSHSYCFLPSSGSLGRLGAKSSRSQLLGFGKCGFLQGMNRDKSIEGVWKVKSRTNPAVQLWGGTETNPCVSDCAWRLREGSLQLVLAAPSSPGSVCD